MANFEERIYELGAATLAEQERRVQEARTRGAALLAAGAVIASLLAGPAFRPGRPYGDWEIAATAVGAIGCAGVLVFAVLLLRPRELAFCVGAEASYRSLRRRELTDQPEVDLALAKAFETRREKNLPAVRQLTAFLFLALSSVVLETAGLALAAALGS